MGDVLNDEYLRLWNDFLELLNEHDISLQKFCNRYYEESGERLEYEPDKFYERLNRLKKNRKKTKNPRRSTTDELESFIEFLSEERVPFKLFNDEKIDNWFD